MRRKKILLVLLSACMLSVSVPAAALAADVSTEETAAVTEEAAAEPSDAEETDTDPAEIKAGEEPQEVQTDTDTASSEDTVHESEEQAADTEPDAEIKNAAAGGKFGQDDRFAWALDENGTLTISGSGDMPDYTFDSPAPWKDSGTLIRTIVIEKGVTGIGASAFEGLADLTDSTIPDSVTAIRDYAFRGCSSLTVVTIPQSVTVIGKSVFDGCSNLTISGYAGSSAETYAKENNIPFQNIGKVLSGWQEIDGKRYYYDPSSGKKVTGWQKIDGAWYYFDLSSGEMKTGWLNLNNTWYYLKSSGSMATGWQKVGSAWYYLKSSGVMATGWQKVGSAWYYLKSSGAMATGWQKVGSAWYYLKSSGAMATGWQKVGSTWYYLKSSGVMATGWQEIGSAWYYLKSSGAMATGWQKVGNTWYYLSSSGAMETGWDNIDGQWYYFNAGGAMETGASTAKREKVVSYMRAMATVRWTPSSTMQYWTGSDRKWTRGTTYTGIPYSQYSRTTTLEQFRKCLSGSTYKGPSGRTTYKGTDCSSSVSIAWKQVNSSIGIRWTGTLTPGNSGISKVGSYVGNISNTKSSCSSTGRNNMYAAYRKLQPGDAVVTHGSGYHVRLVSSVTSNGVYCIEQSGLVTANRSSWQVNKYYSFATLFNNGYVPVTMAKW